MKNFDNFLTSFQPGESESNHLKNLLVIDDDPSIHKGFQRYFSYKYKIASAYDGRQGLKKITQENMNCVILDIKMREMDGFEIYEAIKKIHPNLPIIFYSGFQDEHDVKEILNRFQPEGYFAKGDPVHAIEQVIDEAIEKYLKGIALKDDNQGLQTELKRTRQQLTNLEQKTGKRPALEKFKGSGPRITAFKQLVKKSFYSDITVLVEGETGTGKELIARIIHEDGNRSHQGFWVQNCAAIPEQLFESELFGHKKGAFSGAVHDKTGLFKLADKGTVFLDEIGELPLSMQAKLLRLLQEGEIRQIGSNKTEHVDVRIISATNRDLEQEVKQGKFREDLYYRLSIFTIHPPPLREIKEEIPVLIDFFLKKHAKPSIKIDRKTVKKIMTYDFPGNVRELENEILRALVMMDGHETLIQDHHISGRILAPKPEVLNNKKGSLKERVTLFEKEIITEKMIEHFGNKTNVAKDLGLSRVGLNNKIKRYKINNLKP